jgi:multidrug efflux system membrane fusion protein
VKTPDEKDNVVARINRRPQAIAAIVAVAIFCWMFAGVFKSGNGNAEDIARNSNSTGRALTRVQVDPQKAGPIAREIRIYGQTMPARMVNLSVETDGRVEAVMATRGAQLKKGQVILKLDERDRVARRRQMRARATEYRISYEAKMELASRDYLSESELARAASQFEDARAELVRAEADLEYMFVRAPFDGVLHDLSVEVGRFARAGDTVATFVDNTSVVVRGTVTEKDVSHLKVGAAGRAILATGQNSRGRIRYISPMADEDTRTFSVELELPNPHRSLAVGVSAEMLMTVEEVPGHRISPATLTLNSAGAVGVKAVDEFDRVAFYPVDVIVAQADSVWISAVPNTVKIITMGQHYVSVGQRVEAVSGPLDRFRGEPVIALKGSR